MSSITLRKWSMNDLPDLVRYANNPHIAGNLTNQFPHPYTEESGKKFITFATTDPHALIFAIDLDGVAIGGIGIHPQHDVFCKNAELGYWLAEPFWGRGYITQAIPLILQIAFKTLDIERIFARPFGRNVASQKVLEKNGFRLEAQFESTIYKNGVFEDEWVYAIRRRDVM